MQIANAYEGGTIEAEAGDKIYSKSAMYLSPYISYYALRNDNVTLYCKLFCPDGSIVRETNSPKGFSFLRKIDLSKGTERNILLCGWGHSTKGYWKKGKYRVKSGMGVKSV